jgi:prepilin-type N-terminal cleavage/methylation domain-containing protein
MDRGSAAGRCRPPRTVRRIAACAGITPTRRVHSRKAGRCAAFSLIELIVVVVVIGVMVALIVPQMKGTYEDVLLRSTGRQLADAARLAHSQAITLNAAHRVRIDLTASRYLVERAVRDPERGPGFAPVRHLPGGEGSLDPRVSIEIRGAESPDSGSNSEPLPVLMNAEASASTTSQSVLFYPDGTAEAAEIRIRDRDGFGLALRISPVTGRVKPGPIAREYR